MSILFLGTFGKIVFLQLCHAKKTKKCFLNDIVADLGHTFKLFHEGVPKKVFGKNIVFCKRMSKFGPLRVNN